MPGWLVREHEDLGFYGIDEVCIHVENGLVSVEPTHGATTCEVRWLTGDPVTVHQQGGNLRVLHPQPRWESWDVPVPDAGIHAAEVRVAVTPGTSVRVVSYAAEVEVNGVGNVVVERRAARAAGLARQAG